MHRTIHSLFIIVLSILVSAGCAGIQRNQTTQEYTVEEVTWLGHVIIDWNEDSDESPVVFGVQEADLGTGEYLDHINPDSDMHIVPVWELQGYFQAVQVDKDTKSIRYFMKRETVYIQMDAVVEVVEGEEFCSYDNKICSNQIYYPDEVVFCAGLPQTDEARKVLGLCEDLKQ